MSKKIETFEFPEGSGHKWQVALSTEWGDEKGPAIMIRSASDADEFGLDYWRPALHPDFIAKVEEIAKTLDPMDDGEQMENAEIEAMKAADHKDLRQNNALDLNN